MNLNDFVALAQAGFTKQEIADLVKISQTVPATTVQPAQTAMQTPPVQPAMVHPAAMPYTPYPTTTMPLTAVQPPVVPYPNVTQDQVYQSFFDNLKTELKETVHQAAIQTASQPNISQDTPEDVLAKILDPHPAPKEAK